MNLTKRSEKPIRKTFKKGKAFRCPNCNKTLAQNIDGESLTIGFTCPRCKSEVTLSRKNTD